MTPRRESAPPRFLSLGGLQGGWVTQHCVIPDGFDKGDPFEWTDEQFRFAAHYYRVRPEATFGQLAPAFVYRRGQLVRPQKWGKGPFTASHICLEGVGPALFGGWAKGGEVWDCRDHGCDCGWSWVYEPGDPMGMAWPTPLIQITATSDDQTDNVYDALRPMIDNGPLQQVIPKTGEEFIRLPNGGRIDTVTSNARSRLGQRVTFVAQDETGIWTPQTGMVKVAETQRRGAAGMGGRVCETTNSWDPAEHSVAQRTAESKRPDILRDHRQAPENLDYKKPSDRKKIHAHVYGDSWWVDLDAIEAEASELLEVDPAQAERFFGNRSRAAGDAAFDLQRWLALEQAHIPAKKARIVLGVDGARFHDAIAIVATEIETGYQWPVGIWEAPLEPDDDYEHPAEEIDAAMIQVFTDYRVERAYCDPQWIDHLVDRWIGRWGEKRIKAWFTSRPKPVALALRAYKQAQTAGEVSHNGDPVFAQHIANAKKQKAQAFDDEHKPLWVIRKEAPKSVLKIDGAMAGCLSWEARGDAVAAGALRKRGGGSVFI
jgi:hypothetical protein